MTAAVKNRVMILGGLFGSGLKMWWISGNFPYLSGFSAAGGGAEGSNSIFKSNAGLLYGVEVPKDAMMREALRVFDEARNWVGRSLWL